MTLHLTVTGMTCDGCVQSVTRVLGRVPGVRQVRVDLASGRAELEGEPAPEALLTALRRAGYGGEIASG